jgi:galactonate dehydratase
MKISDIKTFPVWIGRRNQCIVKVETDAGIHGWGEAGLSGREQAVVGAIDHYRQWLIGRDPFRLGALWQEMYRSQYFEGGRALTAAISAIDIALHDVVGKALGVPVYQLLGGKHRERVPCFATTGAPMGPRLIEDVKLLLNRGWDVIRTVPGRLRPEEDPLVFEPRESIAVTSEWLSNLRQEVGPGPVLGIDYHHRLNVAETASFCQRMPPGTLDFLEEPIRAESPEAYEALRSLVDVPMAIGEEFSSKWAFLPFIERGLTHFARIDVCNVGGLTEAKKVAGWAEAHYIDLMPHDPLGPICTAATIHLAAAVPNFAWLESRSGPTEPGDAHDARFFPVQPALDGSCFPVPDGPGLGVEFNEELAAGQEFRYWEAPHLRRRDGSHTNW